MKVSEYPYLQAQILFTHLHPSGSARSLTEALLQAGTLPGAHPRPTNTDMAPWVPEADLLTR